MKASTARQLQTEDRVRQRMRERTHVWWHTNHCPNCQARRAQLAAVLANGDSSFGVPPPMHPSPHH